MTQSLVSALIQDREVYRHAMYKERSLKERIATITNNAIHGRWVTGWLYGPNKYAPCPCNYCALDKR